MSTHPHRQIIEEARQKFNDGDIDGYVETLYAPDASFHYFPPGLPHGHVGARMFYGGLIAAFPDAHLAINETVVEGDLLSARFGLEMTHQGEFQGIPPTGRRVTMTGITIMRFANGKVVERWSENDLMGLLIQLGAMPAPSGA
jgi:predicted ester cyclase